MEFQAPEQMPAPSIPTFNSSHVSRFVLPLVLKNIKLWLFWIIRDGACAYTFVHINGKQLECP